MNFAEAAINQTKWTTTENGAVALNTTSDKLLDFFGVVGALRKAEDDRIFGLFEEAYKQDPLFATKIMFYARDIREGAGERSTFRKLLNYCANYHPEAIANNVTLIPEYGRYDDLYELVGTPLESIMWAYMKIRFASDLDLMKQGKPVSLLAKWIKSADASSGTTRKLGVLTAKKLGIPVYDFKRQYKALRKYLDVTECKMSTNRWSEINYPTVPSKCMNMNRNAFAYHDAERFNEFGRKAVTGEVKINSSTLYPYDIMEKILNSSSHYYGRRLPKTEFDILNAQWNQLPDYIGDENAIVMADTSGSMWGRPLASAVGLAVYFAQRNKGAYHNLWMSFSATPKFHTIKGERLEQIISNFDMHDWDMNTDLESAFNLVLKTAIENNVPQEEMPKSIVVISDMEIDYCADDDWTFYDAMRIRFAECGYDIPNIVFWNVNSRHDVFHADAKRKGVQLVSGNSINTFKNLISVVGMNPVEAMKKIINSERYESITISAKKTW